MSANAFGVEHEVSKSSDWKTIDQRERAQRQNRKHAANAAGLGSAAAFGGAYYGLLSRDVADQANRATRDAKSAHVARREVEAISSGATRIKSKGNVGDAARGTKAFFAGKGKGKLRAVTGLVAGGIGTGVAANAAAGARNSYHQHKINERRRAAEGKRAAVAKNAFGVEDSISKRNDPGKSKGSASGGRRVTAQLFPGFHGAAAGRKGTKLKAVGHELAGNIGGGIAGGGAGALAGAALGATRGKASAGMDAGKAVGSLAGGIAGTDIAVQSANRKGYYKKQKKGVSKAFSNENSNLYRGPSERKAVRRDKKFNASQAGVVAGYGATMTGVYRGLKHGPSKKNLALVGGGLAAETGSGIYGTVRAHKVANEARKKKGLKPRNALGMVEKNGVSKAFSTKPLLGAMKAIKPTASGMAGKAMKLQPVKNAAAGFNATKVGVARGTKAPMANKVGAHAGIGAGHAMSVGGAAMGAAGVGVGMAAGKKRR